MSDEAKKGFEFEAPIQAAPGGGAWLRVPFDTVEAFGTRRSVRVLVEYDGFRAASNVVSMGGEPVLGVHKATRQAIGKDVGDTVRVRLWADTRPRTVEVPPELNGALNSSDEARERYDGLSFTHRREFAEWVSGAKRSETRVRRAAKAVEMLLAGLTR